MNKIKMSRKEKILAYIKSDSYIPLKFGELRTVLDVPRDDEVEFLQILTELEHENEIFVTKKDRYEPVKKGVCEVTGRLQCSSKGYFGFLIPDEYGKKDVFIPGDKLGSAFDGDRVLVCIDNTDENTGKTDGHVKKVLQRTNHIITGIVEDKNHGFFRIRCDNERFYAKIRIKPENMADAGIGDRVVVQISYYTHGKYLDGIVKKNLGNSQTFKSNLDSIIFKYNIIEEFDNEVLAWAESLPKFISEDDVKNRLDLRNKTIFTIDNDDARDFDDAVSIEKLADGNYCLGVHIADVTHYVTENSPLDKAAFKRGTSIYLPHKVIPMLPHVLSNGICSLNPHEDRLTLSMLMRIDQNGNVIGHELHKSVIHSSEQLTYSVAEMILEDAAYENNPHLREKYTHIRSDLLTMNELAVILRKKRMERGSIDFNLPRAKIVVNNIGEPINITTEKSGYSNKLIEEFMIITNETIAEYACLSKKTFIYRIHKRPERAKINEFKTFIKNLGFDTKGKLNVMRLRPKELSQVLESAKSDTEKFMISKLLLRSLMKAQYSAICEPHFGLAAKYYTHFTSPIRRYADLAVHRILKEFIDTKPNDKRIEKLERFTVNAAACATETQNNAVSCERDVEDLMKVMYMSQYTGESFNAVISSVTPFGMFIELENTAEGFINIDNILRDEFEFDDTLKILTGKNTGKIYKVGDIIKVVLIKSSTSARRLDFLLEEDANKTNIKKSQTNLKKQYSELERNKKLKNRERKNKKYTPIDIEEYKWKNIIIKKSKKK